MILTFDFLSNIPPKRKILFAFIFECISSISLINLSFTSLIKIILFTSNKD